MAVTAVNLRSGDNSSGVGFTSRTMAAFTIASGALNVPHIVWVVAARTSGTADNPTIGSSVGSDSFSPITISSVNTGRLFDSNLARFQAWLWIPSVTTSRTITFTWANSHIGWASGIVRLDGAPTTSTIIQAGSSNGSGTALSTTLSAFASSGNATLGFALTHSTASVNPSITGGTGFTFLQTTQNTTGTDRLKGWVEWRADSDTTVDATSGTSMPWAMIGMEISAGSTGSSIIVPVNMTISAGDDEVPTTPVIKRMMYVAVNGSWVPLSAVSTGAYGGGVISGTSTVTAPATFYVVSRTNSAGTWMQGSSSTPADFNAARAAGQIVFWVCPVGAEPTPGTSNNQSWSTDIVSASAADFDPSAITGLQHRWKADTVALTNGASVSSWADSVVSGGVALVQATGASQPTYRTGIANSHAAIRFDGTSTADFVTGTISNIAQPTTWFLVMSTTLSGAFDQQVVSAGTGGQEILWNGGTALRAYAGTALDKTVTIPAAMGIVVVQFNGASSKIWRGGGVATTGAAGSNGSGTALRLGNHPTDGRPYSGDICDIGVYNSALSLSDINTLGAGLSDLYGLTWANAT